MYTYVNKKSILNFYKKLKFTCFFKITDERKQELDEIVAKNSAYFKNMTQNNYTLKTLLSERLTASAKNYGLLNGDEIAYFYIKVLDPELQHLAVYEGANTESEVKELFLKNFYQYDNYLILIEKYYNARFNEYKVEDLWSRENIKR